MLHILDQPRIGRFYFLDKLRFFCAFGVLLYHYTTIGQAPNKHSVYDYPTLDAVFRYGYLGVDVFFMISGFVIFFLAAQRVRLIFSRDDSFEYFLPIGFLSF